jgi:hypothetical protein
MKQFWLAISITILLALGFGYVVQEFIGGIGKGFIAGIILQFIAFMIYKPAKSDESLEIAESTLDSIVDLQTTLIECPCGKNSFYEPIFINKDNNFTCNVCGSKFRVDITHESILLTEPVSLVNVFNNLKDKEKGLDSY